MDYLNTIYKNKFCEHKTNFSLRRFFYSFMNTKQLFDRKKTLIIIICGVGGGGGGGVGIYLHVYLSIIPTFNSLKYFS